MFIKQLSVFVEHKKGKLAEIISALGDGGVDVCALSIADATDFGVLRLIVNDTDLATSVLNKLGIIFKINRVIGVAIDDTPGGLAGVLEIIKDNDISVEYLYAFVGRSKKGAVVVLRTNDNEKALATLNSAGVTILNDDEVYGK